MSSQTETLRGLLRHTVDIVKVTIARGIRSTDIISDIPAFISERSYVIRSEAGDVLGSRTVVFLNRDANVAEQDEIIVDGIQRPISRIVKARGRPRLIHHLEVELD